MSIRSVLSVSCFDLVRLWQKITRRITITATIMRKPTEDPSIIMIQSVERKGEEAEEEMLVGRVSGDVSMKRSEEGYSVEERYFNEK